MRTETKNKLSKVGKFLISLFITVIVGSLIYGAGYESGVEGGEATLTTSCYLDKDTMVDYMMLTPQTTHVIIHSKIDRILRLLDEKRKED